MGKFIALTFAVLAIIVSSLSVSAKPLSDNKDPLLSQAEISKQPRAGGGNIIGASIHIDATPDVVWRAIHEERNHDPDLSYTKVLSQNGDELTLEEKFAIIPIIGNSVCIMSHKEIPNRRIEYKLLKSDHFKALEGSWDIRPADGNRSTELTLTSYVDLGVNIPRSWMDDVTSKKLQRRLGNVKRAAEKTQQEEIVAHTPS